MAWSDPISTAAPNYDAVTHPRITPSSTYLNDTSRPLPTNAWWFNLIVDSNARIVSSPYQEKWKAQGLDVCFPTLVVEAAGKNIVTAFLQNLSLEASETLSTRKVMSHDLMTVTPRWSVDGSHYMEAPLIQGMPYVTMRYTDLTPLIKTQHAITSVNGSGTPGAVTATKFKVVLNNGQTWLIYASSSLTLTWSNTGGWRMLAGATYTGSLRICNLDAAGEEAVYDTYKDRIPTGVTIDNTESVDTASMIYTFSTIGSGTLAMFSLQVHRDYMVQPIPTVGISLTGLLGEHIGVSGSTWNFQVPLHPYSLDGDMVIDSDRLADVTTAVGNETTSVVDVRGSYTQGKLLGRIGRIAQIADETGLTAKATSSRNALKSSINPWLDKTNVNVVKYDQSWGGLCTLDGLTDGGADYGMGNYNDHHFHWGYFILAAAYLGAGDAIWLAAYLNKVNDFVRDIANPSTADTYFTRFRCKDWYSWHSWAHGITGWGDGKNQESTSEAVMGYYGVMLWGQVSGQTHVRSIGRLLMAMEIYSTQEYYQVKAANASYPEASKIWRMWSIVSASKVEFTTFFGNAMEYIYFIQVIPILPATLWLWKREYIEQLYPIASKVKLRGSTATASVGGGVVTGLTLVSGSDGYGPYAPNVNFSGGGGTGAAATATVVNGVLTGLTLTNPGTGYSSPPTVSFDPGVLSDNWENFLIALNAYLDPEQAWTDANALSSFDEGNSKANELHFIACVGDVSSPPPPVVVNESNLTEFKQVKNNARSRGVLGALNNTTDPLTFSITATHGARFPATATEDLPFWLTIWDDTVYYDPADDPNMEIVLCTARPSADSFTITRGQLNTTAHSHPGTPAVKLLIQDQHFIDIHNAINNLQRATTLDGVPTKFAFNSGVLQKQNPLSETWENFTIRGLNFSPTPPGYNPDDGRIWDAFCNISQVKWFCDKFNAIHGNAARIYWPGNGQISVEFTPGVASGIPDTNQIMRTLDVFYQYGIYVMVDVFVRFYPAYDVEPALKYWYMNNVAQHMVQCVALTRNHPAIMGYIFGNETNLIKNGDHQNLGGVLTISEWWQFANQVAYECRQLDTNHIYGVSSGLGNPDAITEAVTAENTGQLSNYDFHGANIYRGDTWNQPSNGTSFWTQWNPTNNKPVIITETGCDSFDTDSGLQDEANQASNAEGLWNTLNTTKCPGIFFFSAFDEIWKPGEDGGSPVTNDENYASIYYDGDNDGFYITPDLKGNEQHFGWWKFMTALPYARPPAAKQVVAHMATVWAP